MQIPVWQTSGSGAAQPIIRDYRRCGRQHLTSDTVRHTPATDANAIPGSAMPTPGHGDGLNGALPKGAKIEPGRRQPDALTGAPPPRTAKEPSSRAWPRWCDVLHWPDTTSATSGSPPPAP